MKLYKYQIIDENIIRCGRVAVNVIRTRNFFYFIFKQTGCVLGNSYIFFRDRDFIFSVRPITNEEFYKIKKLFHNV